MILLLFKYYFFIFVSILVTVFLDTFGAYYKIFDCFILA